MSIRAFGLRLQDVGLGLLVVFLGISFFFPDVISRLRQSRSNYVPMEPSCRLSDGPCTVRFVDGTWVRLSVEPPSAPAAQPLRFRVEAPKNAQVLRLELQGKDMNMGFFQLPLTSEGSADPRVHRATGVLPVCTLDRMAWRADVILEDQVAGFIFWSEKS